MKVHQVILTIIDFDELGADQIKTVIENQKYPNHCIGPTVESVRTREIGEWSDDNPLNCTSSSQAELERLFGPLPKD
jgi:hypothetical protein